VKPAQSVSYPRLRLRRGLAVAALLAACCDLPLTAARAQAAGCQVQYTVTSSWPAGFSVAVSITSTGPAISGWTLQYSYPFSY
jgi:rhamnogalacturonan endolyase